MERAASLLTLLVALFPAAVLVTAVEGGKSAVWMFFRRIFRWRIGLAWWLVVVGSLPALTVAIALMMGDSLRTPSARVLGGEVVGMMVAFLLINLWEEAAWAGFLQTRLERRHNLFVATLLTIIPFAAIHVPLRMINGATTPAELAQAFLFLLILGVIVRPLMAIALRATGDSIFAVALLHTMFNRSNNIDGIAADLLSGPNRSTAALIATLLLTVAVGISVRRRLGRACRQELDTINSAGMGSSGASGTSIGNAITTYEVSGSNVRMQPGESQVLP
jgi:membrane protease YdiL (CAAX protease family)